MFLTLGGESSQLGKEINWNASHLSYLDPRIRQSELEVQNITHLQRIANELLVAFPDIKRITKCYMLVENAPIQINVPVGQSHARSVVDQSVP